MHSRSFTPRSLALYDKANEVSNGTPLDTVVYESRDLFLF